MAALARQRDSAKQIKHQSDMAWACAWRGVKHHIVA